MSEETSSSTYEKGLMHGQHKNQFFWVLGAVLIVSGMIGGYILGPDDWSLLRKLAAGTVFSLWCGFCVFGWHMLLYGTVEEEDEA